MGLGQFPPSKSSVAESTVSTSFVPRDLFNMCNVTAGQVCSLTKKTNLHTELVSLRGKQQLVATTIQIAEIFEGFSLYFGTSLDFRLRMYPLQYLLSRTSGFLKHVLEDFLPRTLTLRGHHNMLEAYYAGCPVLTRR